tara:strand:+ start:292 stop:555 length:264 start_codon:yes stop_codon:yes gene_type:complete
MALEPQSLTVVWISTQPDQEFQMTDNNSNSGGGGGNAGLAFIVGGIVVVLAIVAYFVFSGASPEPKQVDVDVSLPEVSAPSVPAPAG